MLVNKSIQNNFLIPDTVGIALCGGNSNRMQSDKSLLTYYKKPQRYHVYDLLTPFCEQVFISCNQQQANSIDKGYSFITDLLEYADVGPMAAVLSAFTKFPDKNLLLIGCDYPFLASEDLQQFSAHCGADIPVSFYNEGAGFYEPLLAFYPSHSFSTLKKMFEEKQYSLQHYLRLSGAKKYLPLDKRSMQSIDTKAEFIDAFKFINA